MSTPRPTVSSLHGVVAAAHPLAAQAGARVLSNGGNAFDAAAATAAALNVVEPYMSGLAGQGLATCYVAAEKRVRVLDFVPRVPSRFPVERFDSREQLARGPAPVGTPGNLAGWCELVGAYGTRRLPELFASAIKLARDGFPLIEFNVAEINGVADLLGGDPATGAAWAANYTGGARSVAAGSILRQPDLANTLEVIAEQGPSLLYGGELGKRIVAHLASIGGFLTEDDLLAVKPEWKEPLTARYRDLVVNVPPPPCEGFQYLLTLRILDGFDLGRMARDGVEHVDTVLRAIRLAAGVRIANNDPSPDKLARLMADDHVEKLRARVRDGKPVLGPTEQWQPGAPEGHTTSFSIGDREGNLVCVTQSLGAVFGSGVVVPGTGVCLNNFLYWADVNPASPNRSKPGEALPMCMAPGIATREGAACLALGTPGSYGILQTQPQALVQYVDFGLKLQAAIEAPRTRLMDGREAHVEARVATDVRAALAARGHEVMPTPDWTMKVGGMQAVARDPVTGALTGACDPRRDGYVATA